MLLKQATLEQVRDGKVTVQFRRWRRPTVKTGGTLVTSIGQLAIHSVEPIELAALTAQDASNAGFDSLDALQQALRGEEGQPYRIRLSLAGPDPRIALRNTEPDAEEVLSILKRLDRRDARSPSGPWTQQVLQLIERHPSRRAADLADQLGLEKRRFKGLVRSLKALGLTISETVGYRLSARGLVVLRALEERGAEARQ